MEAALAGRMERLGTETAFEVLARARELEAAGHDVLHFELGEPDFTTPEFIVEAGCAALREGWTHYGPAAGQPDLRAAIADVTASTRGVPVDPEEVVVVPGAKPIIFFTLLALVEAGDEVLVPDPSFPIYDSMVRFCGGTVVPYHHRPERDFAPDPEEIAGLVTDRTKLLILNSPGNPTGGVLGRDDLARIARTCVEHDLVVLSDEIYSSIVYDGPHESILPEPGMKERTILLDGFSKTWAMTGWRMGWGVMPRALAARVTRLQVNSTSCTASFSQRAGLAAVTGPRDAVDTMVAAFRRRRDAIVAGLNSVRGFECAVPRGAFYAFPSIAGTGLSAREVQTRLMEEAHVATVAGPAFGAAGEGFVRFSFAQDETTIARAIERVTDLFGAA